MMSTVPCAAHTKRPSFSTSMRTTAVRRVHRNDARRRGEHTRGDRCEVVDLELGRGRPRAAWDHRIADGAEHVVAERGDHAAVEVPERSRQLVTHVDLRAQQARADLGVPEAEEARQAPARVDEPFEALRHLLVVVRELAGVTNHVRQPNARVRRAGEFLADAGAVAVA